MNYLLLMSVLLLCGVTDSFSKISIVTRPINPGSSGQYGGHKGVTRSLVEGFKKLKIDFNYNPSCVADVGETVIVLADVNALKQAIQLKRNRKIKKLLAGPNLMVWSFECGRILGSPEIDVCIVPSEWVKSAYEVDESRLKGKISIWFAGVDEHEWLPARTKSTTQNVVVYWKTGPELVCKEVEDILKRYGWNPYRIRYGSYAKEEFKKLLAQSAFSVFLSASESQGLALAESWAMNVPTLVLKRTEPLVCNNKTYPGGICASPYLTSYTGMEWKDMTEFEQMVQKIDQLLPTFEPRQWVLSHMTDIVSAQCMLQIVGQIK
jgi:hypothetical protein